MKKGEDMILAAMSPSNYSPFTPVQLQKLMFLIDEEIGDFKPYHYDGNIYSENLEEANDG